MLQHLVNGVGYANMSLRAGSGKHIALAHCQLGRVFIPECNLVGRRIIQNHYELGNGCLLQPLIAGLGFRV